MAASGSAEKQKDGPRRREVATRPPNFAVEAEDTSHRELQKKMEPCRAEAHNTAAALYRANYPRGASATKG